MNLAFHPPKTQDAIRFSVNFPYGYWGIAKSASTSVRRRLWELERTVGCYSETPSMDQLNEPVNNDDASAPWHSARSFGKRGALRRSQLTLFTFVRNPFARILSAYLDKMTKHFDNPHRKAFLDIHEIPHDASVSFAMFVDLLAKQGQAFMDVHWHPQMNIIRVSIDQFDFIGRVENIDRDFTSIIQSMSIQPVQSDWLDRVLSKNFLSHSTGAVGRIEEFYTQRTADIVRDLYCRDFDELGYSYDIGDANLAPPIVQNKICDDRPIFEVFGA